MHYRCLRDNYLVVIIPAVGRWGRIKCQAVPYISLCMCVTTLQCWGGIRAVQVLVLIIVCLIICFLGRFWWSARYRLFARSRQDLRSCSWWRLWSWWTACQAEIYCQRQWWCWLKWCKHKQQCIFQWQWYFTVFWSACHTVCCRLLPSVKILGISSVLRLNAVFCGK